MTGASSRDDLELRIQLRIYFTGRTEGKRDNFNQMVKGTEGGRTKEDEATIHRLRKGDTGEVFRAKLNRLTLASRNSYLRHQGSKSHLTVHSSVSCYSRTHQSISLPEPEDSLANIR